MEPYTLEWWLDIYFQAERMAKKCDERWNFFYRKQNYLLSNSWKEKGKRYGALLQWIYNRIIQKYGE